MKSQDRSIYLLTLRGQQECSSWKHIELYGDRYNIKRMEFNDEKELVDEALRLLEEGKSVIIAANISAENIEKILLKTNPRKQFVAFNTIKSHQ